MSDDDWTRRTPEQTGYTDMFAITELQLDDDGSKHSFTVTGGCKVSETLPPAVEDLPGPGCSEQLTRRKTP